MCLRGGIWRDFAEGERNRAYQRPSMAANGRSHATIGRGLPVGMTRDVRPHETSRHVTECRTYLPAVVSRRIGIVRFGRAGRFFPALGMLVVFDHVELGLQLGVGIAG